MSSAYDPAVAQDVASSIYVGLVLDDARVNEKQAPASKLQEFADQAISDGIVFAERVMASRIESERDADRPRLD